MYDADHYVRVTEIYLRGGTTPTLSVAKELHLSRSAAAKHVDMARQLGLLDRTTRGKTSGANRAAVILGAYLEVPDAPKKRGKKR